MRGSTITEKIRQALAAHIALVKENTDLVSQAESAMADIEREAAARREAIAALGFAPSVEARTEPATQWWIDLAAAQGFDWKAELAGQGSDGLQAQSVPCR